MTRARRLAITLHDLRDAATDVHRTVDDAPFGGGAGMVLTPGPVFDTVERVSPPRPLFLLGPGGRTLDQPFARELAALDGFSLLCGRYEGVDDRVRTHLVDGELSVGDVVLAGGEVASMVVLEAVGRLVPGVMGNDTAADEESFADGLLEGFAGCNHVTARYVQDSVGAKAIAIGRLSVERGGCDARTQIVQTHILDVLQSVSSYSITGDVMKMSGSAGSITMRAATPAR